MSFNQLPNELIALIASKCGAFDVVNLLQTQNRVNKVLKGYKIDKPAVESVRIEFKQKDLCRSCCIQASCHVQFEKNGPSICVIDEPLVGRKTEFIGSCLEKFRLIISLTLSCSDRKMYSVKRAFDWISLIADKKIKKMKFYEIGIKFKPAEFVSFCQMLEELKFEKCRIDQNLMSDEVLCKVYVTTKLENEASSHFDNSVQLEISDRTLDAMISGKTPNHFTVSGARTKFTISGVRRFVEHCLEVGIEFTMILGILNLEHTAEARLWRRYWCKHRDLPYEVNLYGIGSGWLDFQVWKIIQVSPRNPSVILSSIEEDKRIFYVL